MPQLQDRLAVWTCRDRMRQLPSPMVLLLLLPVSPRLPFDDDEDDDEADGITADGNEDVSDDNSQDS